MKKIDAYEKREQVAQFGYWEDPRWKLVRELRKDGMIAKSNNLVLQIRSDYGLE